MSMTGLDEREREKDRSSPATTPPAKGESRATLIEIVRKAGVGLVLFLMVIAALQLYFGVQEMIRMIFSDEAVLLISILFYLCVIGGGIFVLRRFLLPPQ